VLGQAGDLSAERDGVVRRQVGVQLLGVAPADHTAGALVPGEHASPGPTVMGCSEGGEMW
jgi:hypothetical protein